MPLIFEQQRNVLAIRDGKAAGVDDYTSTTDKWEASSAETEAAVTLRTDDIQAFLGLLGKRSCEVAEQRAIFGRRRRFGSPCKLESPPEIVDIARGSRATREHRDGARGSR